MPHKSLAILFLFSFFVACYDLSAQSDSDETLKQLKLQLDSLKVEYEQRIKNLETQIEQLQIQLLQAPEPETTNCSSNTSSKFPRNFEPRNFGSRKLCRKGR